MDQQYEQLSGKTVLIIAAGDIGLQFVWKTLHDCKLKVILVDPEEKLYVKDYIHSLIKYNYIEGNITEDESHADNIIQMLGDKVKELSACFTYDDDFAHLAALLCQKLELIGITPFAARTVNSKKDTYDIISRGFHDSTDEIDVIPAFSLRINTVEEILNATETSYPAILKPEYGCFSDGVTEVSSQSDCITQFKRLQQSFGIDWFGGKYGSSMVLMEFLRGVIYQTDLVICNGNLLKGIVCVMGPKFRDLGSTFPQVFSDTTTCFSSCLPQTTEKDLINASFRCCQKIGLNNGVYNVEMMLTNTGYRLVEINGRPGSYRRCSAFKVTHGLDVWITYALIACGIKPILPEVQSTFAVGCYLYSFLHRTSLSKTEIDKKVHTLLDKSDILYIKRSEVMAETEDAYPKPYVNLVALDKRNIKAAKMKLIDIFHKLELLNEDYNIEKMTELFA